LQLGLGRSDQSIVTRRSALNAALAHAGKVSSWRWALTRCHATDMFTRQLDNCTRAPSIPNDWQIPRALKITYMANKVITMPLRILSRERPCAARLGSCRKRHSSNWKPWVARKIAHPAAAPIPAGGLVPAPDKAGWRDARVILAMG